MRIKASTIAGLIANEAQHMSPLPTQYLSENLAVIQDSFVNIFFIKDNGKYIAIDAGLFPEQIRREMAALSIDPSDVKAVLLTHSDIDHVAGISAFPKAEVFLPETEVAMLGRFRLTMTEEAITQAESAYGEIGAAAAKSLFGDLEYWPDDDMEVSGNAPNRKISFLKNILGAPYRVVRENETLSFDHIKIQSVALPGHTTGLTGYIVNDCDLFASDSVRLQDGDIVPFNAFLNRDEEQHRATIDMLKELRGFDRLFTHHYGYTDDLTKAFKHWRR